MDEQWMVVPIAEVAHEVNRAYCAVIGDPSQVSWDDAPDWQRDSACEGARYALANPETTPRESHEGWYRKKEQEGWTYGPVKDADAQTHPCMVPYDQLPQEQRVKDYLFLAVVRSVARVLPRYSNG